MEFICPVCGKKLIESEKSVSCRNAHLFDKAKKGYVNLLLGRDASLHGDSKQMALARFEVMQSGIYAPLKDAVIEMLKSHLPHPAVIADCGCGECYYTCAIDEAFADVEILATDISKDILAVAHRRKPRFPRAVASSFALPIASSSCDAALNIFSPFAKAEYERILKPKGLLLMVIPLENHLWELKEAVYEKPYKNAPKPTALDGFSLSQSRCCTYREMLDTKQLISLFEMTPYAIKTAAEDARKLTRIPRLSVTFSFEILLYRKEC